MKTCLYIIIVSLNPGERLRTTLESIFSQTIAPQKIIIKDGGSTDGSLEELDKSGYFEQHKDVEIVVKSDKSIYDGMNQAVEIMLSQADDNAFCMFLNCGDRFHDEHVIESIRPYIEKEYDKPHIVYGDQFNIVQQSRVVSAPEINEFTLFRNVPCHQVCFYQVKLFRKRAYNIAYTVRADYEHFLYCCYDENAECEHVDVIICDYEGGGYSETAENIKRSAAQHREITDRYMGNAAKRYRLIMLLTLAPLRTRMAQSPVMSGIYNGLKNFIYKKKA